MTQDKSTPWQELLPIAEGKGSVLIATGQWRAAVDAPHRVGLFLLDTCRESSLSCAADVWMTGADIGLLREALAAQTSVREGEWDVMYATPWNFAWTTDGDPFATWDRKGLLAQQVDRRLHLRSGEEFGPADMVRIEAYLSADWVQRGVALVDVRGNAHTIAEERDTIAQLDPTYDEMSIMLEAGWTVSMADAMARSLEVPMKKYYPL